MNVLLKLLYMFKFPWVYANHMFMGLCKSLSSLLSQCWSGLLDTAFLDVSVNPSRNLGWIHLDILDEAIHSARMDDLIQKSWMTASRHPVRLTVVIISWLIVVSFREQIWRWECEEPVYWPNHSLFRPTDPAMHPGRSWRSWNASLEPFSGSNVRRSNMAGVPEVCGLTDLWPVYPRPPVCGRGLLLDAWPEQLNPKLSCHGSSFLWCTVPGNLLNCGPAPPPPAGSGTHQNLDSKHILFR